MAYSSSNRKKESYQGSAPSYYDNEETDLQPPSEAERLNIQARRKKNDSNSTAVASKLLEGWALLNDYCTNPDCAVPLMRNRANQIICVSCNQTRTMESKTSKTSQQTESRPKPQIDAKSLRTDTQLSAPLSQSPTIHTGFSSKGQEEIGSLLVSSLYSKLDQLRIQLENCHEVEKSLQLISLMNDCSSNIKILQALGHS